MSGLLVIELNLYIIFDNIPLVYTIQVQLSDNSRCV